MVSGLIGIVLVLTWAAMAILFWLGYSLLRQNGRTLLRLEALEARLRESSGGQASGEEAPQVYGDRSLAGSKINRDGLARGTTAPPFTLPRVDGGELSLNQYAGRRVLLVFSDPDCAPCDWLAPRLQQLACRSPDVAIVMVSRGDVERNQQKVVEHRITFPVVLQEQWKLSREYAKFATPVGYLIDEYGRIAADIALGADAILALASAGGGSAAS